MSAPEPSFSRIDRKNGRNRVNKLLNIMIAAVAVLIVVTAAILFSGNDSSGKSNKLEVSSDQNSNHNDENNSDGKVDSELDSGGDSGEESTVDGQGTSDESGQESLNDSGSEETGIVTTVPSDDEVVSETVINSAWKPIGTTQTGEHISIYVKDSVDWEEKVEALAYATGLQKKSMIVWKLGNGGSPQKSIGIVSSNDRSEKYRVNLEWVDNEGWKPVQMDKLLTLDFDY